MPELPEVETIKLGLQKKIIGLTIKEVEVLSPKSFIGKIDELKNKKILQVWRRAKMLGINLGLSLRAPAKQSSKDKDKIATSLAKGEAPRNDISTTLLFHLKMTGQLIWIKAQNANRKAQNNNSKLKTEEKIIGGHPTLDMVGEMPNSHTRVIFEFSDGSHLYFNDQRRFGWVKIIQKSKIKDQKFLNSLGPEPLSKEFTWQVLKQNLLRHKSMPVKVAIMDQSVVSGVGNIYSSEACFDAKIDPKTKVKDLSDPQFKRLYEGIIKSLTNGIKHGGSSRAHFVDSDGRRGYFLDYAYVYGRDKKPCKKCGTEIKKITLAGRGTYFCQQCQR